MKDDVKILITDKCTEKEAEKYLASGTEIYTEQELIWMVENEMSDDMGYDESDRQKYLDMIQFHKEINDWSIVKYGNEYYYIAYVL